MLFNTLSASSRRELTHLSQEAMARQLRNDSHQSAMAVSLPYSVFTVAEKWFIVSMVAYAAWFSTLSSFIYYPALHALSETMSVSIDKINLTVTTYMAVATIAPTLVGDAADVLGRRPMYLLTLSLYIVANLAIALTQSYPALLGLRVMQALAISGAIYFRC